MEYSINKILKGILSLSISKFLSQLITALSGILIARYLNAVGYGQYHTIVVYAGLFFIFCDCGTSFYLQREGSRTKDGLSAKFGNVLLISIFLCAINYCLMIGFVSFTGYSDTVIKLIYYYGLGIFFLQSQKAFFAILQVNQKQEIQALSELFSVIFRLLFYVGAVLYALGLKGIVLSFLFSTILSVSILGILIFWKFQKPSLALIKIPALFKGSYLFALSGILTFIYFQSDVFMISLMRDSKEVGLYSASYKLIILFNEIPIIIINSVLLPLMYSFSLSNQEKLVNYYRISGKYLLMLGLPLSIACAILADKIIMLLYGQQFYEAFFALKILAFALVARFMASTAGAVLTSLDYLNLKVKIQSGLALFNIVMNFILIKKYGFIGAAYSTLLTEILLMKLYFLSVNRYFYKVSFFRDFKMIKIGVCSVIMGSFLLLTQAVLSLQWLFFSGLTIYFASLYVLKFFYSGEIRSIFNIIQKG